MSEAATPTGARPRTSDGPGWLLPAASLTVACTGLFAAGVLSIAHLLDLPVPCGESGGCITVAAHPASSVLGVPIALVGVAAHVLFIVLILWAPRSRRARSALATLTGVGTLLSAGLLIYSQAVIRATCPWCIASGAAMCLLFVSSVWIMRRPPPSLRVRPVVVWCLLYATGIALGAQAGLMDRAANEPPLDAERLAAVTAAEFDDPAKSVGAPDAPVTIVMFSDFGCPACRAAHASLREFQGKSPDGVRVVIRHLPLRHVPGHEMSWEAAVLSEIAAEQGRFGEFVDAVYAEDRPLDGEAYVDVMRGLGFDAAAVEARLGAPSDPALARVSRDEKLASRLGVVDTPTFVVLAGDDSPVSASLRTLPSVLNSPAVQAFLAWAARAGEAAGETPPR